MADVRLSDFAQGEETNPEKWAFENMTLDSLMMVFHMLFWFVLVILIESRLFRFLKIKVDNPVQEEAEQKQLDD